MQQDKKIFEIESARQRESVHQRRLALVENAKDRFRDKSYTESRLGLYAIANVAKKALSGISVAFAVMFLFRIFFVILAGKELAQAEVDALFEGHFTFKYILILAASTGILVLLEIGKHRLIDVWAYTRLAEQRNEWYTTAAMAAIIFLSIYTSVQGGVVVGEVRTEGAPTQDLETMEREFGEEMDVLRQKQADIKKSMAWKGTLTQDGQKAYNKVQDEIAVARQAHLDRITTTRFENAGVAAAAAIKTANNSGLFFWVAFLVEALILLVCWYTNFWQYKAAAEARAGIKLFQEPSAKPHTLSQPAAPRPSPITQAPPVNTHVNTGRQSGGRGNGNTAVAPDGDIVPADSDADPADPSDVVDTDGLPTGKELRDLTKIEAYLDKYRAAVAVYKRGGSHTQAKNAAGCSKSTAQTVKRLLDIREQLIATN